MRDLPEHATVDDKGLIQGPHWYPDPPYLDTTCLTCKAPIKHNGSNGGVFWSIPGWEVSAFRRYDCPNNVQRGYIGQHVPAEVVSVAEVEKAITSIGGGHAPTQADQGVQAQAAQGGGQG